MCNFAPRGNIRGKPVYALGLAATQCPESFIPDEIMKGLCAVRILSIGKISLTALNEMCDSYC